jgi:NAD(P)-dependent dehydrogenase (short-subunit alcohol dehydrogenase family)
VDGRLAGKVALVTGAGRGIGRAHALALADEGASVLVADVGRELAGGEGGKGLTGPVKPSVGQEVADEIVRRGGTAVAVPCDVSTLKGGREAVQAALEAFGDLHILVNNAGVWYEASVGAADGIGHDAIDGTFGVHFLGTVGTTEAAFEVMRKSGHGGRIINTTSGFGAIPVAEGLATYWPAKAAVAAFTLSTAYAGLPHGITANGVAPLAITGQSRSYFIREGILDREDQATIDRISPEQNSPLVVFLASDAAAGITGRLFDVSPESFTPDTEIRISERFMVSTPGAASAHWTVDQVEASISSILRSTPGEGSWHSINAQHKSQQGPQ